MELVAELGRGAVTVVYRARREGREYAVKMLRAAGDEHSSVAFRREAALLARLTHVGLVGIHEVGEAADRPYLIMDLVGGQSLAQLLASRRMDEDRVIAIAVDVTGALTVAHGAGLVHRDIKPDNIMIDDGRAKLIDFGLAVHAGTEATDVVAGTFRYAAPEQTGMLHRPVDGRSDLYALGVVLFESLTGAPPFVADDVGELMRMHLSVAPPDVRDLRPEVSPMLAVVIGKLLAKDPDDRYASSDALLRDLTRLATGERERFEPSNDQWGAVDAELVGQEQLTGELFERWRVAQAGRGGIALLLGAPGAGKSRLARQLTTVARAAGHIVLHGKSDSDGAVPLAPLRAAVDRHVGAVSGLPAPQREAAVQRLRVAAGPMVAALRAFSPALTDLLGVSDAPTSEDDRQFAGTVVELLVGLARSTGGAVLHLDDVQWWDEGTSRVIRQLVPLLPDVPLLLVLTARDDTASLPAVDAFLTGYGAAVDVRLSVRPLDDAAVERLVVGQLGEGRAPRNLITALVARGGGNPMAVQQYIRAVVDAGLIRPSWGTWLLDESGLAELALPDDVADLVVVRVEGLGDLARELLTTAAAIGTRFEPDLAALVSRIEPGRALTVFTDAIGRGLIEPAAGGYGFLHDRIREALMAKLDEPTRRDLHQRIAEALEQAGGAGTERVYRIARHYLAGDLDAAPERVFDAAWAAGTLALSEHAAVDAVYFLTCAADAARRAGHTPSSQFHAALGTAAIRLGRYALSIEHLDLALSTETRPVQRARLYMEMAVSHYLRWEGNRAIELVFEGLAEVGRPMPRNPVLRAAQGLALFVAGIVAGWLPDRLRLVTGETRDLYTVRAAMLTVGTASAGMVNKQPLMLAFIMPALRLVNRLERGSTYAETQGGLAICAAAMGWNAQARRMYPRIAAAAADTGDRRTVDRMEYLHSIADEIAPPMDATTGQVLRRVLTEHARGLDEGEHLNCMGILGGLQVLRGYCGDAAEMYQRGVDQFGVTSESLGSPFATLGALAAALSGQPAKAAAQVHTARQFIDGLPDNQGQLVTLAVAEIQGLVEQGEIGAVLDEVLARFAALKANPASMWSFQRALWVYQAFGRLAQLATAEPERHAERHAQARQAIRDLHRVAKGPVLDAYHRAARASLSQLTGDNRAALRALARLDECAGGLDLPLLDYETARIRARAWRDLGRREDAARQAAIALLLADRYGWRTRARWIRSEFDLADSGTSVQAAMSTAGVSRNQSATAGGVGGNVQQRRLQALHQVGAAASTVLDPARLATVALDEILSIFGAERAFVFLQHAGGAGLEPFLGRTAAGTTIDELTGYGSTLVQRVHDSGTALVVTGSEEGQALGSRSAVVHGLRSIMVAPLVINGRHLGVVYLDSRIAKGIFTSDDVDTLAAITNHVAASLETARAAQLELAVHAAERERDTAEVLRAAMSDFTASLDPDEVGHRLVARVTAVLPDAEVRLLLGDDADLAGMTGPAQSGVLRLADLPAGVLPAAASDGLVVPMLVRGDRRGAVAVSTTGRPYTDAEVGVVAALVEQAATALDNAALFHQVQELATRDELTGLYNRRYFFQFGEHRIQIWNRHQQPVCALMIDIDHFKSINDTHGHAVGDEVIREAAARMSRTLRETDLVCRYGGEEFAALLPETDAGNGRLAAGRLHQAVCGTPMSTAAGDLTVTVSVGLAGPDADCIDVHTLLKRADEAMYAAKRAGRNRVATADLSLAAISGNEMDPGPH